MKTFRLLPFLFFAICLFTGSRSANAQDLYFYLHNNTGSTISKVFVSPRESSNWNNNIIPRRYLYDETQLTIYIPSNYGATCLFDIKIVATNGEIWKFTKVDICSLYRLTVNYNNTYHTEWATY